MEQTKTEALAKIKELVENIDFAMLTTLTGDQLRSRPMSTQQFDDAGNIWFFTSDDTRKVAEVERDARVNIAYAKPESNTFVSVSGRATLVKDRAKMAELWSPIHRAWFPAGLDDPQLALLKVDIEEAEYWDAPNSKIVQVVGLIKALATGQEMDYGDHGKVQL